MTGLDPKYSMLVTPYRGASGFEKHEESFSARQVNMLEKLDEACSKFKECNEAGDAIHEGNTDRTPQTFKPNPELDENLVENLERYKRNKKLVEMRRFRRNLPVYDCRKQILDCLNHHQVFVLSGETGCGKTTQVTQYILDHYIAKGVGSAARIVCTQPRRVAAVSVADRVAAERGDVTGGGDVGYQIKMDAKLPRQQGSILYCTSGILLQRLQSDPTLAQFNHVLLDEVHERDSMTDIILVLLKELLPKRNDLKVIIMSATLNGEQLSRFFFNCPVLKIPGFMHPVQPYYLKEVLEMIDYKGTVSVGAEDEQQFQDWISHQLSQCGSDDQVVPDVENYQLYIIASLINKIHQEEGEGGVLVFLPGWDQICALSRLIQPLLDVQIFTLHSSMSPEDQRLIFFPTPPNVRKIVIATNIAESSVTIDDIVYVIDSGRAKIKMFDVHRNMATLSPHWISKANCIQRKGRAGRLREGKVYKIFSRSREDQFSDYMPPEIVRSRLDTIVLRIKRLGYLDVARFMLQLIDAPNPHAVVLALTTLTDIGAINVAGELTAIGEVLSGLTVEPQLGKMMVLASVFSCLDPILTIVAALEYKSPFHLTKNNESVKSMDALAFETCSDHLAIANAFEAWSSARMNRTMAGREEQADNFCRHHNLSYRVLSQIEKNKKQYGIELSKLGVIANKKVWEGENNQNSGREAVVRAVITLALLPNIATIQEEEDKFVLKSVQNENVNFHPRSVNRHILDDLEKMMKKQYIPRYFVYYEVLHTTSTFLTHTTSANKLTLALLASNLYLQSVNKYNQFEDLNSNLVDSDGDHGVNGNVEQEVEVQLVSGRDRVKLLVCEQKEAEKLKRVRLALNSAIQSLASSSRSGRGLRSEARSLVGLLVRVLSADSAK